MTYELGIIGGMGPLATSIFFDYLVRHTEASRDQDHIKVIILNDSQIPDRTQAYLTSQEEVFLGAIKEDFDILNAFPLRAVAIPCNTSHIFYDRLAKMSRAPVINMVEETILACKAKGARTVTVLGTRGTLASEVYEAYAGVHGLKVIRPEEADIDYIMEVIYGVKATGRTRYPDFDKLIKKYRKNSTVILACTELSCLDLESRGLVDALKVLGKEVIRRCGRRLTE